MSEILTSVLQTVQKKNTYGQYIFTDCTEDNVQNTHTYTQYLESVHLEQLRLGAFILHVYVTTLQVKLICGKYNRMGMIWKGKRLNKMSNS